MNTLITTLIGRRLVAAILNIQFILILFLSVVSVESNVQAWELITKEDRMTNETTQLLVQDDGSVYTAFQCSKDLFLTMEILVRDVDLLHNDDNSISGSIGRVRINGNVHEIAINHSDEYSNQYLSNLGGYGDWPTDLLIELSLNNGSLYYLEPDLNFMNFWNECLPVVKQEQGLRIWQAAKEKEEQKAAVAEQVAAKVAQQRKWDAEREKRETEEAALEHAKKKEDDLREVAEGYKREALSALLLGPLSYDKPDLYLDDAEREEAAAKAAAKAAALQREQDAIEEVYQDILTGKQSINDRDAIPLFTVNPDYPSQALGRGIEGWVEIQFSITTTGSVKDAVVVESSSQIFEQAAIMAIRSWRFNPKIENGEAVERVGMQKILRFELE